MTGQSDYDAPYDAIVVLGAAVLSDGQPSPAMGRRVEAAVDLYGQGVAPRLVMTGGAVGHPVAEARVMRGLALEKSVPAEAIVTEDRSRNTWQNATEVIALARTHGWERLVIVSDAFHIPRAKDMFRRQGMAVDGHGAPRGTEQGQVSWALAHVRESLSWLKHWYLCVVPPRP